LLERNGEIRHRRRYFPDNPDAEKHGRELIQMKLSFDDDGVNRAEIKFPVKYYRSKKTPADYHSLLGIVDRNQRPALIARIVDLGIPVNDLRPTLTLSQTRRRVYISRDGNAFATITLDCVRV
jgi:cation diffusion facilitator CzcD-associated flavoprotein CzcO